MFNIWYLFPFTRTISHIQLHYFINITFPCHFSFSPHRVQQEAIIKQKEDEEKQHQKMQRHAEAIRHQVRERELSAVAKRREIFKEADRLVEEARQRRMRLDDIKEKKLKELK